jgi:hypothetical protein
MEVIMVMSWSIWTIRNDAFFRGMEENSQRCLDMHHQENLWTAFCNTLKFTSLEIELK